jgi:hypothetical protein
MNTVVAKLELLRELLVAGLVELGLLRLRLGRHHATAPVLADLKPTHQSNQYARYQPTAMEWVPVALYKRPRQE